MNVIVANKMQSVLAALEIEVIKNIEGEYTADELVEMFKNFFFARMILDVTAIKEYQDIANLQKISIGLDVSKIILLLPNDAESSSTGFLSKLISMGFYNFTTNLDGVKYLLEHPNSYRDVAHIQQLNEVSSEINEKVMAGTRIIGVKNVTDHAGSTTLIYMLKKELEKMYGMNVVAIEVGKRDFPYFNDKNMFSVSRETLATELLRQKDASVILVDLNDMPDDGTCEDVLYLIEPTSIKLNKLMRRDRRIFERLKGKKIVLNKSLLTNSDIMDFEYESKSKVFYNMPPVDERSHSDFISQFLEKLGLIRLDKEATDEKNKILGLFKF